MLTDLGGNRRAHRISEDHADYSQEPDEGAASLVGANAIWIAWERQRRTTELARQFRIPLFRFGYRGPAVLRYMVLAAQTLKLLRRTRPEVLIIQNPSLVLNLWAAILRRFLRFLLVVDRHTNFGLSQPPGLQKAAYTWVSDWTLRHSDLIILTNGPLAAHVTQRGGRAFVLPDRIPDMPQTGRYPLAGARNVCFICSFAADEPYRDVIAVAEHLPPDVHIYITGDYTRVAWTRGEKEHLAACPRLTLTGFLTEVDYANLLHGVDVVMDLTTLDHCIVCGAYEAIAAGKALVLSKKQANLDLFGDLPIYVRPIREEIMQGVLLALAEAPARAEGMRRFKAEYETRWHGQWTLLRDQIEELARQRRRC